MEVRKMRLKVEGSESESIPSVQGVAGNAQKLVVLTTFQGVQNNHQEFL